MLEVRDITRVDDCMCGNIYYNGEYVVGMYVTQCALLNDDGKCDDEIYQLFKKYAYEKLESIIFLESMKLVRPEGSVDNGP